VTDASHAEARRIAFRVEYEGTHYHGWQAQPGVPKTIQEELETALSTFCGTDCSIQGASRTDAGVHARDQLAATTITHRIGVDGLVKAMNNRLPRDIALRSAREVSLDYNPRFGNHGKTYTYRIYLDGRRQPLIDRYSWRQPWALDLDAMAAAAKELIGTHDYTSFAAADGSHVTAERTLYDLTCIEEEPGHLLVKVTGSAFMKNMVRILIGTLAEVGRGRMSPGFMREILAGRDRRIAGPTAPPNGLELTRIYAHFEEAPAFISAAD
jgi:tRNA pseudouridine38-40 synthase